MLTHILIATIFAITVFLAFIEDYLSVFHKTIILIVYACIFIIMATTKSVEHTADALVYEDMFMNNDSFITELTTEPSFIYISRMVLLLGGTISTVFFIYAVISIPAKITVFNTMTPYIFTALLIYIPIYFEVQDMIQIRVAAAVTFLLMSLVPLANKHLLPAALLMILAILFHYSAAAALPFLFIGNRRLNKALRILVACLLPICFAMYLMKKDLFFLIPSGLTEGKLDLYKETSEKGQWDELQPLYKDLYFLSKCTILYLCLYFYDYIVERNRFAPILINLFAASIFFLLTMATIPVIASRVSDLFGIIDCIVFTFCLYLFYPKYVPRIGIAIIGLYVLILNILYSEHFTK